MTSGEVARGEAVVVVVVQDIEDDAFRPCLGRKGCDLDFGAWRDPNVEDRAVTGEPGIGPSTVVANPDWRRRSNDMPRTSLNIHPIIMPGSSSPCFDPGLDLSW